MQDAIIGGGICTDLETLIIRGCQLVKRSQGVADSPSFLFSQGASPTRELQILRVFCLSEAPLSKGAAGSPSFLFKRGVSLQGDCRFAEFSIPNRFLQGYPLDPILRGLEARIEVVAGTWEGKTLEALQRPTIVQRH
jgi:hypothetical protein